MSDAFLTDDEVRSWLALAEQATPVGVRIARALLETRKERDAARAALRGLVYGAVNDTCRFCSVATDGSNWRGLPGEHRAACPGAAALRAAGVEHGGER